MEFLSLILNIIITIVSLPLILLFVIVKRSWRQADILLT